MRVVALFRVSTEQQASDGASLDSQERTYRELAAKSGWTTVADFRGYESATKAASDREVLQRVLQAVRDHEPDALYVHEQSRLTRGDELEVALLLRELREQGIKIIVGGVVRDLDRIDERFMVGIQSLVDRAEAERIRERVDRGKREKALRGLKNSGPAPYGYLNPRAGDSDRGILQPVLEEAAIVRRIFERIAAGSSVRALCAELNAERIPSPRGGLWGTTTIERMLINPVYIGTQASRCWVSERGSRTFRFDPTNPRAIVVKNAHPPILSETLWHEVQDRVKPVTTRHPRLLTGFLWVNGAPYVGDTSQGALYYRARVGGSGHSWFRSEAMDSIVWSSFLKVAQDPSIVKSVLDRAEDPKKRQSVEQSLDKAKTQIGRSERRLDRLVEMRADGEITRRVFEQKAAKTKQELADAEKRVIDLESQLNGMRGPSLQRAIKALRLLVSQSDALDRTQKRVLLQSSVRRIDVRAVKHPRKYNRDVRGRIKKGPQESASVADVTFSLRLSLGDCGGDSPTTC